MRKENACLSEVSLHFLAAGNKINFRITQRCESICSKISLFFFTPLGIRKTLSSKIHRNSIVLDGLLIEF